MKRKINKLCTLLNYLVISFVQTCKEFVKEKSIDL